MDECICNYIHRENYFDFVLKLYDLKSEMEEKELCLFQNHKSTFCCELPQCIKMFIIRITEQ